MGLLGWRKVGQRPEERPSDRILRVKGLEIAVVAEMVRYDGVIHRIEAIDMPALVEFLEDGHRGPNQSTWAN
jgi:hypothetical protein